MTADHYELADQSRFVELVAAANVAQLHRILLLSDGSDVDLDQLAAATILHRHHGDGQPGVLDTVLLLCTDRGWRHTTAPLIAWLAASGLLSDAELDELAEHFLQPVVSVEVPDSWFGPAIVIALDPASDPTGHLDDEPAAPGPVHAGRQVRPPLRRWAAARRLRAQPESLAELETLASELDTNAGARVAQGLCDALDVLPDDVAAAILAIALRWPRANVRKLALERLIDRGDRERAHQLAADDPDAEIRRWSERMRSRHSANGDADHDQQSLFDQ